MQKPKQTLTFGITAGSPRRISDSISDLFFEVGIPGLAGEVYVAEMRVRVASPTQEAEIAQHLADRINSYDAMRSALVAARALLDSVAYVSTPGESERCISNIDKALKPRK